MNEGLYLNALIIVLLTQDVSLTSRILTITGVTSNFAEFKVFTDTERYENVEYFSKILLELLNDVPAFGKNETSFKNYLRSVSTMAGRSLYKIIKDKMTTKIDNDIEKNGLQNLFWESVTLQLFLREKNTTVEQYFQLDAMKYKFLPQVYENINYTQAFYPYLKTYILVFVAITMDMIQNGQLHQCKIVNVIRLFSKDVKNAIQSLIYKRYSTLRGVSYQRHEEALGEESLQYLDSYDNHLLCTDLRECLLHKLHNSFNWIKEKVLKEASGLIMFVDKMLVSVQPKSQFCFNIDTCDCKNDRFEAEHLNFEGWPTQCYGKLLHTNTYCDLPCDTYNQSKTWCVHDPSRSVTTEFKSTSQKNCEPPHWDECVDIPVPYL